jgi:hypothetical protein
MEMLDSLPGHQDAAETVSWSAIDAGIPLETACASVVGAVELAFEENPADN